MSYLIPMHGPKICMRQMGSGRVRTKEIRTCASYEDRILCAQCYLRLEVVERRATRRLRKLRARGLAFGLGNSAQTNPKLDVDYLVYLDVVMERGCRRVAPKKLNSRSMPR